MAIAEYATQSSLSISTTEISLISGTSTLANDTTDGFYQLFIDASAMAKADVFEIRIMEKVKAAGTKRQLAVARLNGVQSEIFAFPALILMHGWDMTMKKIAGTDRAFDSSIRQVA